MELKGKKVLVVGLGILGGGVATAQWLIKQGANITVTDLRSAKELRNSLKTLGVKEGTMTRHSTGRLNTKKEGIRFILGEHRMKDFTDADLVVVGPGVKIIGNRFLAAAKKKGVPIVNDLTLFLDRVKNPVVAITGTRGKTTTTNWTAHFLRGKYKNARASGNSSDDALLKLLPRLEKNKRTPAVLELSSFQLELADHAKRGPDIAVVTNISRDHLNRHETMRNYALAKANIFKKQTKKQALILNYDNPWTKTFLSRKPRGRAYGFLLEKKPAPARFLACADGKIIFGDGKKKSVVLSKATVEKIEKLGEHNIYNFLAAALAAHLAGISWKEIEKRAARLPGIPLRQEVIIKKKNLVVVNDSAGTSPEATIAGVRRFAKQGRVVLLTGGTDKNLEFHELAREIKKSVVPGDLFLLNGSATKKLVAELKRADYFKKTKPQIFEDLKKLLLSAKLRVTGYKLPVTLLFSPGSASFEKFKNEFDRGERFALYSKTVFK